MPPLPKGSKVVWNVEQSEAFERGWLESREELLSAGDNLEHQELEGEYGYYYRRWTIVKKAHEKLEDLIRSIPENIVIDRVIANELGNFSRLTYWPVNNLFIPGLNKAGVENEYVRLWNPSMQQLLVLVQAIELIRDCRRPNPIHNIFFQKAALTLGERTFFGQENRSLGYPCSTQDAQAQMSNTTFFFGPTCGVELTAEYLRIAHPALCIGAKMQATIDDGSLSLATRNEFRKFQKNSKALSTDSDEYWLNINSEIRIRVKKVEGTTPQAT